MGVVTNGFALVPTPQAELPPVGLIASLSGDYLTDDTGVVVDGHSNRWELGYQYQPENTCLLGGVEDPCNAGAGTDPPAQPGLVEEIPYRIWAGDKCSTFGWQAHDFVGRSERALLATESALIASEFWHGTQATASSWPNGFLANRHTADVLTLGPLSPGDALACLEQGIGAAGNGQRGMIHCTRQLGAVWSELGSTFRSVNGLILTYMGTIIVPDAGYDGSGTHGQAAVSGAQWAYATGMVTVRRSPIEVVPGSLNEAIIRGTNLIQWKAQRYASASFNPCIHLAVEVNLPLCAGTGTS